MSITLRVQRYFPPSSKWLHVRATALQEQSLLPADTSDLLRVCLFGHIVVDFIASTIGE